MVTDTPEGRQGGCERPSIPKLPDRLTEGRSSTRSTTCCRSFVVPVRSRTEGVGQLPHGPSRARRMVDQNRIEWRQNAVIYQRSVIVSPCFKRLLIPFLNRVVAVRLAKVLVKQSVETASRRCDRNATWLGGRPNLRRCMPVWVVGDWYLMGT